MGDHQDFEAGLTSELESVNEHLEKLDGRVRQLGERLAWVLGGLGVLAVVANILAALIIPRLIH